jgi:hypothetical protein
MPPADGAGAAAELADSPPGTAAQRRHAVHVLFVAGFGRSGSTLLDRLLGSTPGLHSGGELCSVWKMGLAGDELCSCGTHFSSCRFWRAAGDRSFSALRADEIDGIAGYLRTVLPAREIWRFFIPRARRALIRSAPAGFFDATARLYESVQEVSGQRVIVDSSKLASYLILLAHMPSVNVHVVHLVREPRAVMHSWLRLPVADPEGRALMPRFGAVKSAVLWLVMNAAAELAARRMRLPYVRVRYEDLVRDPAGIVAGVRSGIASQHPGLALGSVALAGENATELDQCHIISGNPMRFRHGPVAIAEDDEWKAGSRGRRAIAAAITLPLRWRYGYVTTPGRA